MDTNGSTSSQLEDPRTDAEPEEVDQERDDTAAVTTEPEPQTEPAGDAPEETSAPEPQPEKPEAEPAKAPQGTKPERSDPVKDAIARLRSDKAKPGAPAQPSATTPEKPAPQAKDQAAAQPDQRAQHPDDPALAWMSPEQRKHTKGSVKEYIRQQHAKLHEAHQAVETSKGDAAIGQGWAQLIDRAGLQWEVDNLTDSHIAAALKTQGAIARVYQHVQAGYAPPEADLKALDQHRQSLDAIDRALGRASGEASLHQGDLPQDLTALAELGLSERELRLIAADRARQTGKAKPSGPALAPAPQPRAAQPPPNAQPRQPQAATAQQEAETQLYRGLMAKDIVRRFQVPADQVDAFYQRNLVPHVTAVVAEMYPKMRPDDAFAQLRPQAQRELVNEAIQRFAAANRSNQPAPRRPAAAPLRTQGAPNQSAAADPVQGAIDRLRSD